MKAYQHHSWSWDIDGLSLHNYTVVNWENKLASVGFGNAEYAQVLHSTLEMDSLINKHSAIMDTQAHTLQEQLSINLLRFLIHDASLYRSFPKHRL